MPGIRNIFIGRAGLRAGWGVLLFAAIVAGCIIAAHQFFPSLYNMPPMVEPTGEILRNGLGVLVVLGATWVLSKVERRKFLSYGLAGAQSARRFTAGSIWGLILFSLLVGILVISRHLALIASAMSAASIVKYAVAWMIAFFLVAFLEENLFRGYVLATLARGIGFWPAAAILSVGFGLAHLRSQNEVLLGIGTAILGGLVFSLALRLSGSLWWGIGFHAAWDWAESFLYGTADSGYISKGSLLAARPVGDPVMSGGTAGPEGSIFILPVMAILLIVVARSLKPAREKPAETRL